MQQQYRNSKRNFDQHFDELRKNEQTSRAGLGWDVGEEDRLLSMRLEKATYDDIAAELKRTSRSIQTRLYLHICKLVDVDNEDLNEQIKKYDIDSEDFASFKTKREEKMSKFEYRKEHNSKPTYRKPAYYDASSRDDKTQYIIPSENKGYNVRNEQYISPYENKGYNVRNELNILRQEVYELRKQVNGLGGS
jgi:hypothetical protein